MATERSGRRFGVGASVLRKEDDRHLRGRGQFVADIALRGTQEVVFLRSPHAHAEIRAISVPPAARGQRLHRRRPAAHQADPGGDAGGRRALAALAAARHRQGALCRRGDRRLRRTDARRSGRPRRCCRRRLPAAATRWSMRSPHAPAAPRWCTNTSATICSRNARIAGGDIEAAARAAEITVTPRIPHEPAVRRANGVPRRARLSRPSARRGRGLRLDPDAAHDARRARRNPRDRGALHPGRRARCRRRLRAQGAAVSGGDHPHRAGAGTRPSGALDRGPQRTSADRRAFARSSLPRHGVRRPAGPYPRHRLRDHRRCRRLWHVAARSVSGSQHGGALPAWPLHDPALPRPHLHRRDQQDADRSVSRRRPSRRLLRGRAHHRRSGPRGRPRSCRGAHREHDPARADALRLGHRHALRQRRLPGKRAALRRIAEPGRDPRTPAAAANRTGG